MDPIRTRRLFGAGVTGCVLLFGAAAHAENERVCVDIALKQGARAGAAAAAAPAPAAATPDASAQPAPAPRPGPTVEAAAAAAPEKPAPKPAASQSCAGEADAVKPWCDGDT